VPITSRFVRAEPERPGPGPAAGGTTGARASAGAGSGSDVATGTSLRITHCPINTAGIPWENVQALRRRGVDARLVVFNRYRLHPEADWSLERPDGLLRAQLVQLRALARLLPRTDVFHFYFGLTLVPKSIQFPLLRATGRRSVMHFLGSDIRGRPPGDLAWARRAGARVVGSYDALRWVPDAEVVPPGIDLSAFEPVPPSDRARPVVLHAPSDRRRKGTQHVVDACASLDVELEIVEGLHHAEARERYRRADIVVDQLNSGWYGRFAIEAMALGKPVLAFLHEEAARGTEDAFGAPVPIVATTKETLAADLRRLVGEPAERRRIGAASRAYVERVHDADLVADRLLALYSRL
jgi:glycosyltransferase involved in cell wall biosynthesis